MLRIALAVSIVALAGLCAFVLYAKYNVGTIPKGTLEDKQHQFSSIPSEMSPQVEFPAVIKEINSRNENIKNLSTDDLEMKLWQNGHRYRLSGKLYYEKPKHFRMEINSILGKEVDVGSNETHFWYWSRRDPNPGLHYASHGDLQKTRLKTPFNPLFLRACLGAEVLPAQNCKVVENQKDVMVVYPRENAMGEPVLFSVFVSKEKKRIEGYLVTNKDGKTLASCEIQEFGENGLPSKILFNWNEENRVMLMELNNLKMNAKIDADVWTMPNYTPKINMADEQ